MTSRHLHTVGEMHCSMKLPYASERIATIRAEQLTEQRGVKLYAYRCRHCKKWHHTKSRPRRKGKAS